MIGMVEDVLKSGGPKEDFTEQVFDILSRYGRPVTPWDQMDEMVSTLREIGEHGRDGFIKALESPYFQTRRFAVRMLPDSGLSQEVIEELLKKALNDTNRKVRKLAFLELAHIMDEDEVRRKDIAPHLLSLLTDPSWHIRSYVAWRLYYFEGDAKEGCAKYVPLDYVVSVFLDEKDHRVQQSLKELLRAVLDAQESDKDKE